MQRDVFNWTLVEIVIDALSERRQNQRVSDRDVVK